MDRSLDEIINDARVDKKGKGGKGKGGKPQANGKNALVAAVNQSNKMKRAAKQAAARGMDIDLPTAPIVQPRNRNGKGAAGKAPAAKGPAGKQKKSMVSDTLKARIAAAVAKQKGKLGLATQPKATPTKAGEIKITIAGGGGGSQRGNLPSVRTAQGGQKKGKGKGGILVGKARGIVKPGMNKLAQARGGLASAMSKGIQKKARTVIVAGGKGNGPARGGGRGQGRGGRGTLASRFKR